MKKLNKNLLVAGMATAAIVAPTAALADTVKETQSTHAEGYVEMLKPNGETTFVHYLHVQNYMVDNDYSLTVEGKKQLENEAALHAAAKHVNEIAIETINPDGEVRYVHYDFLEVYLTEEGYKITEEGKNTYMAKITAIAEANGVTVDELGAIDFDNLVPATPPTDEPGDDTSGEDKPDGTDEPTEEPGDEPVEKPVDGEDNPDDDFDLDDITWNEGEPMPEGDGPEGDKPNEEGTPVEDVETLKGLEYIKIKDIVVSFGGEGFQIDLNDHFKTDSGNELKYEVIVQEGAGSANSFVKFDGGHTIAIDPKKSQVEQTSVVIVKVTDGGEISTQQFRVSIDKNGNVLPQTGSESGFGIAGAIGAVMLAAGAVVAARRARN